jgi:hypothetical protein
MTKDSTDLLTRYDFGTFDGGYWPTEYCVLDEKFQASEIPIREWNRFEDGEIEYWPSGDKPELTLLFDDIDNKITCQNELRSLANLLDHLGGDSSENYLRIRHAMGRLAVVVGDLSPQALDELPVHIFIGTGLTEVEEQAVGELATLCGGQVGDASASGSKSFLDRLRTDPNWQLEPVAFGDKVALLVWPTVLRFSDPIPACK